MFGFFTNQKIKNLENRIEELENQNTNMIQFMEKQFKDVYTQIKDHALMNGKFTDDKCNTIIQYLEEKENEQVQTSKS